MATDTSASVLGQINHVADVSNMVVLPLIESIGDHAVLLSNNRFCLYNFNDNGHIEKTFEKSIAYNGNIFYKVDETAYTNGSNMLNPKERFFINNYFKNGS